VRCRITVESPDTSIELTGESSLARAERGNVLSRSRDFFTAVALSGVPSLKRIPFRILIVTVFLSAESVGRDAASCGTICSFALRS
jgi:hypothetical protein